MVEEHFDELKEWSVRKHAILKNYLAGFARILGSRDQQVVYYVDGFAGPGLYEDGNKGSPTLAAELAQSLIDKSYALRCINIEIEPEYFANLVKNTAAYSQVVRNLPGSFGDQVEQVLGFIKQQAAIFFLDPFGLKGIEWQHLSRIGQRRSITEILLRVSPIDLQRLAGFWNSADPGAPAKCQLLTDLFGFSKQDQWLKVWLSGQAEGLVTLYMERLRAYFPHVYRYPIRAIDGDLKYYLIFATRHPKGAVLMNDVVYLQEEQYRRDAQQYQENQGRQMGFFGAIDPTPEQVDADRISRLKAVLQKRFVGQSIKRQDIRATILDEHFGRFNKPHFTRAITELRSEGSITALSGNPSEDSTVVTFRA
jgi:three-Cys-motif partner protein